MSGSRRVAVLGGSFDPLHIGHLIAAEEAVRQLGLEQVLLTPAKDQWRKAGRRLAAVEHRVAMVRLAVEGNPKLGVSEVDVQREGPSYTKDTLSDLRRELGDDTALHCILGWDAIADLPNWREPERIVELATLVAVLRPGYAVPWTRLEAVLPDARERVVSVTMPEVGISSTEVRRRIAAGESVRYWVPDTVREYIQAHHLYGA